MKKNVKGNGRHWGKAALLLAGLQAAFFAGEILADEIYYKDGTCLSNVFVMDEGLDLILWRSIDEVPDKGEIVPQDKVKSWKYRRGEELMAKWDKKPELPDLDVTHVSIEPRNKGLHGRISYDGELRPIVELKGQDLGDRNVAATNQIERLDGLSFRHEKGEMLTFIGHVKNLGFARAKGFGWKFFLDGREVAAGKVAKELEPWEEVAITNKVALPDPDAEYVFEIEPAGTEIARRNNSVREKVNAWGYYYIVGNKRARAWHEFRSGIGTFSFEDYYRWHADLMNRYFENCKYPSTPKGCKGRVRIDRIIYTDENIYKMHDIVRAADGDFDCSGGGWTWRDSENEIKTGKLEQINPEWRCRTEWSLPHELGHQLGLIDWYNLDFPGSTNLVWKDTGRPVSMFFGYPEIMMHWHGPQNFSEVDAAFLNETCAKPRGYFGDHVFAFPLDNVLEVRDINGEPLSGAKIEMYQRYVVLDKEKQPVKCRGGEYYPVLLSDAENQGQNGVDGQCVLKGTLNREGRFSLPNRPCIPVKTYSGYERKPNPCGNIDVLGRRGNLIFKVSYKGEEAFFGLTAYDFNLNWFRGNKKRAIYRFKTMFNASPEPQGLKSVAAQATEKGGLKVTWQEKEARNGKDYRDRVSGFKVYVKISDEVDNQCPWEPVALLGPDCHETVIEKANLPDAIYFFGKKARAGVTILGPKGQESGLVSCPTDWEYSR